jgi:hypothetical protein
LISFANFFEISCNSRTPYPPLGASFPALYG